MYKGKTKKWETEVRENDPSTTQMSKGEPADQEALGFHLEYT